MNHQTSLFDCPKSILQARARASPLSLPRTRRGLSTAAATPLLPSSQPISTQEILQPRQRGGAGADDGDRQHMRSVMRSTREAGALAAVRTPYPHPHTPQTPPSHTSTPFFPVSLLPHPFVNPPPPPPAGVHAREDAERCRQRAAHVNVAVKHLKHLLM